MAQLKKNYSINSICYTSDVWPHKNNHQTNIATGHSCRQEGGITSTKKQVFEAVKWVKISSYWNFHTLCENFILLKFSHTSNSKQCESGDTQPFQKYKVWSTSWATWWKAASLTDMILEILFFFFFFIACRWVVSYFSLRAQQHLEHGARSMPSPDAGSFHVKINCHWWWQSC